jgi:hypothetical protein
MSFISAPHAASASRRTRRTIAKTAVQQGPVDIGAVGKKGQSKNGISNIPRTPPTRNGVPVKGGKGKDVGSNVPALIVGTVVDVVPVPIPRAVNVVPVPIPRAVNVVPAESQDILKGQWQGFSAAAHELLQSNLLAAFDKGYYKGAGKDKRE